MALHKREHEDEKIIQIMTVPESLKVHAVYQADDGTEEKEQMHFVGLWSDGTVTFLEPDNMGSFEPPEWMSNFKEYEYKRSDQYYGK